MPAPNIAQLQGTPNALLVWLRDNMLRAPNINAGPPGTTFATFGTANQIIGVPSPPAVAVNQHGRPMDVFDIGTGGTALNGVSAYICNYTAGGCHHIDLGGLADFCFTVTLNGCSFGVGPHGGGLRAAHANSGGNVLLQRGQLQAEFGVGGNMAGITMLEPADYRRLSNTVNLQATVFGIRNGAAWQFYFQCYSSHTHGNYRVYGVFPFPG
jgi:hypothetical protein